MKGSAMSKTIFKQPAALWLALLLFGSVPGCSDSGSNFSGDLFIKMIDAPASFQSFQIVINRISIHRTGSAPEVGWSIASTDQVGPIDLLTLRNGKSTQVLLNKVAIGTYDMINIHFGPCTINENRLAALDPKVLDGKIVNFEFEVTEKTMSQLSFDFDVFRSLNQVGES
jgi:hypothetical protein